MTDDDQERTNVARVDTKGDSSSSRTAPGDLPCQHCGKVKAEHVKAQMVGGDWIFICPRNTYEPFDLSDAK